MDETLRQQKYSGLGRKGRGLAPYTRWDAELLAGVDEAHETLSGPATQKILQREFHGFGEQRYQRLARISVAHPYRLRKTAAYRKRHIAYQPARPVQVAIGERRALRPEGRSGCLGVDTVHRIVGATARIGEAALEPVLEAMLKQLPFRVRGFHSDNGSEFIN